jgi:hypothetical protein
MMFGWYFDVLVGYLIRTVIRTLKARGSGHWPVERAKVTGSRCDDAAYGGPVAEVTYTFTHNGEYCSGMHREPFLLSDSAKNYAERFPEGGEFIVRVKPREPETSIVCDDDQAVGILK